MPQCPPRGEKQHGLYASYERTPNTVLRDCPKARGFTRFRRSPGAPRGGAFASTLDLFAVHFARFSSRKSASASPDATARGAQHASPPLSCRGVAAKICMRFVGKAKHGAAIIRRKIRRSLASDATSQRRRRLAPPTHPRFRLYLTACVIKLYLASSVESNDKGAKGR